MNEPARPAGDHGRVAVVDRSRPLIWAAALAARPLPPSPNGVDPGPAAAAVTLLASNVECGRGDPDATSVALVARDADIVCAVEHTAATRRSFAGAGLADRYAHIVDDAHASFFGSMLASRFPIVEARVLDLGGRRALVVDLDVDGRPLRVAPVHVQAPVRRRDLVPWRAGIDGLGRLAAEAPGPAVLPGDWNATYGNPAFRRMLTDHGLADAHRRVGARWPRTWPADGQFRGLPLPACLGLDHVVVTHDVVVDSLVNHLVPSTDHLALEAALRF